MEFPPKILSLKRTGSSDSRKILFFLNLEHHPSCRVTIIYLLYIINYVFEGINTTRMISVSGGVCMCHQYYTYDLCLRGRLYVSPYYTYDLCLRGRMYVPPYYTYDLCLRGRLYVSQYYTYDLCLRGRLYVSSILHV